MKSLNRFASVQLSDETLSEVHAGRGSFHSSGGRGPTSIVIAPVVQVAVGINIATQIGGSNAILQSISIGQFVFAS